MPVIAVGTVLTLIDDSWLERLLFSFLWSWHRVMSYRLNPICFSLCRRASLMANDIIMVLPKASAAAFAVVPVSTTLSIRQGIRSEGSSLT